MQKKKMSTSVTSGEVTKNFKVVGKALHKLDFQPWTVW